MAETPEATNLPSEVAGAYRRVGKDIVDFFHRAGGWVAIGASPYTHVALLVTFLCYGAWRSGNWSDVPLSVLPALLGFSLAAYALLLAFGDEHFRSFLANVDEDSVGVDYLDENLLLFVSSTFLLFVVVQVAGLALAIVGHAHPLGTAFPHVHSPAITVARDIYAFVGYFFFIFSVAMGIAAGLNIFHATKWYVMYKRETRQKEQ